MEERKYRLSIIAKDPVQPKLNEIRDALAELVRQKIEESGQLLLLGGYQVEVFTDFSKESHD